MNKKHVPVTDMTFGQLYDAVEKGEIFFDVGHSVIYIDKESLALESKNLTQEGVWFALSEKAILKALPWDRALNGTWENGTWCICSDGEDKENKVFSKVLLKALGNCPYVDHTEHRWPEATPLPQDLADQLEALCN